MAVKLGSFVFQDLEIPEAMPFSGAHSIVKHQLIGGGRTLDAMGDNPDPIEWSGTFLYGDAANRARALDAMKVSGATFRLTWGTFSRRVKIARFSPIYLYEYRIPYKICVEILPSGSDQSATQTLDNRIQGDFDSLGRLPLGPAGAAAVLAAQAAIAAAAAASATGQLSGAPASSTQAAQATAQAGADALLATRDAADAALPQGDLSSLPGAGPQDYAAALTSTADAAASLSDADSAAAYMGRISGDLSLSGG